MKLILTAIAVAVVFAPSANASPEDPHGDDYVSLALSPSTGQGGYGMDGTAGGADSIAMSSCAQASGGAGDCVVASAIHHGCVVYVIAADGPMEWAGGRGVDAAAALADAQAKLPVYVRAVDAKCST